jgi:hypothetical protein
MFKFKVTSDVLPASSYALMVTLQFPAAALFDTERVDPLRVTPGGNE